MTNIEAREKLNYDSITAGDARRVGLADPKVAQTHLDLKEKFQLKPKEVEQRLNGNYDSWRALNMLILTHDIKVFDGLMDDASVMPRFKDDDHPMEDKETIGIARGTCLTEDDQYALGLLSALTVRKSISSGDLEKQNKSRFKKWISTFCLSRAGWVHDTDKGITITPEGLEIAIDLGIAEGYEEEHQKRRLKRNLQRKASEGNSEIIRLKGNIVTIMANKAYEEITINPLAPESLEEIDPLKLRDLLVYKRLQTYYSMLLEADTNDKKEYFASEIRAHEEMLSFMSPEDFESKLEDLGKQKYQLTLNGESDKNGDLDEQIQAVEELYECLRISFRLPGPYDYQALLTVQKALKVPFWSDDWNFQSSINYAYNTNHVKDSAEEAKITKGSRARISSYNYEGEKEWEVVGFKQGLFSGFFSNYQFAYLKDSENWLTATYLGNIKLAE